MKKHRRTKVKILKNPYIDDKLIYLLIQVIKFGEPTDFTNVLVYYNQGETCADDCDKVYSECECEKCETCDFNKCLCTIGLKWGGKTDPYIIDKYTYDKDLVFDEKKQYQNQIKKLAYNFAREKLNNQQFFKFVLQLPKSFLNNRKYIRKNPIPPTPIYQEKNGFLSHNKNKYDINKIFKITHNKPLKRFHIKDLIWILKESSPLEKKRVARADYNVPIIITKFKNKYLVVDGVHRLQKLINDWNKKKKYAQLHNKKFIPLSRVTIFGKYITNTELEKSKLDNK